MFSVQRSMFDPKRPPIEVAAGLIFRHRKLLITQRRLGDHLGGHWEFPGGKREPGETFEECLRRELLEELGVEVEAGQFLLEVRHTYPEKVVQIRFFRCVWRQFEPQPLGCQDLKWVEQAELSRHSFPDADTQLVEMLLRESQHWH